MKPWIRVLEIGNTLLFAAAFALLAYEDLTAVTPFYSVPVAILSLAFMLYLDWWRGQELVRERSVDTANPTLSVQYEITDNILAAANALFWVLFSACMGFYWLAAYVLLVFLLRKIVEKRWNIDTLRYFVVVTADALVMHTEDTDTLRYEKMSSLKLTTDKLVISYTWFSWAYRIAGEPDEKLAFKQALAKYAAGVLEQPGSR